LRTNNRREDYRRHYTLNQHIAVETVRALNESGEQIGIMTKGEALDLAQKQGIDVVLLTPHANPPVVKIIDFNKFLYQESKKNKEAKKGIKKSNTKDVQLSLFIGQNDLDRMSHKALEFLKEGHQVRIKLALRGRELGKKPMAYEHMERFMKSLGEINVSSPPKMQGRMILAVVSRKK